MSDERQASVALQAYRELERRIRTTDEDALRARWEFGRALLGEREAAGGRRLPNGRREELASALGISRAEINNRMQFAEEYAAEERLANALADFGSWHEIVRQGLGDRQRAPAVPAADADNAEEVEEDADEFDAYRVPVPLREWLGGVTQAAYEAGAALGDNQPGTQGVGALRAFLMSDIGRRAWQEWLGQRAAIRAAA